MSMKLSTDNTHPIITYDAILVKDFKNVFYLSQTS